MPFSAVFDLHYVELVAVEFVVAYSAAVTVSDWVAAKLVAVFAAFVGVAVEVEHFEAVVVVAAVEFVFVAVAVVAVVAIVAAGASASVALMIA